MEEKKGRKKGKAADSRPASQAPDAAGGQGHDHRLTVVCIYASRGGTHDIVEAIATVPGPAPGIRRFRFMLDGVYDIGFGWLIGLVDDRHAMVYGQPDDGGYVVRLRARVQELQPID